MGMRKHPCFKCPIGTKRRIEFSGEEANEGRINVALMHWFSHATWVSSQEIVGAVDSNTTRDVATELNMTYSSVRDRLIKLAKEGFIRKEGDRWYSA